MNTRVSELIESLGLEPHPEGGYFREVYRSEQRLTSPVHGEERNAVTDIYFLLAEGQVSRLHKVLHDEIWHLYEGSPLELIEIDGETQEMTTVVLDSGVTPPRYQYCISGGLWQAARPLGAYSLVGCTVAPGFDFADFTFLTEGSELHSQLQTNHPELIALL
ncbi:MAG: cupin domain-containing protein [Planctomycetota bacterium]|jgi:predicted cupin superfamily sugar epimerase